MKQKQFLDSLMDKRLSFALKRCRFESRSVSFCLHSFNLLVFILDFVYTWIYLFESGIRWMILILLFSSADFFSKLTISKHPSGTLSECQPVCIQIRTDVLSVLTWKQTVCKGYQQTTKVAADKKRVRKASK